MQKIQVYFALLLVTVASPALSYAEQEPSSSNSVPFDSYGNVVPAPGQPQSVSVVSNSPAVVGQPSVSPSEVVPQAGPVGVESVHHGAGPVSVHQSQVHHHQQHHPAVASYYSPAGLVTVVGDQQQPNKPGSVRTFEQYGQPESASVPPNYKPFGSWGLYIGGNPADGYYTNYYKALSNTVDKQQAGEPVKPSGVVSPTAALSPVLRQAGSSPYPGGDYYPFAYSSSDFTSSMGVPSGVPSGPSSYVSPVQAGAQVYGAPASFESNYASVSPYADSYATKKVGAAYAQKEVTKEAPGAPKGYQSRIYSYPPVMPASAPIQPPQVMAYPVPVGSQIVGSQPGVDGAFTPYGVHAFTRYAVKPTVVSQDSSAYYYGVQGTQVQPSYKQQPQQLYSQPQPQPHQVYSAPVYGSSYYPMSFYGYPLNQLHYSQGSVGPQAQGVEVAHHSPLGQPQVESASDKVETEDKMKQQKSKRA